ncbi:hypothetical protein LTSEURB_0775 [Salmonella enterica subsp. enterica serovar Urbana str. R8-2977]|uniref:Uncharacterized protein n=1 Tax=Salmonella enterica subsp. enterica serovar Urbana str. R8-2977 TaxID=913084 RepID=G5RRM5_SALET|nr:hypothetical protein LTSEURB_0775 [Salmonella enterica subsp. enterica serovar Urbana str. R8-2977]
MSIVIRQNIADLLTVDKAAQAASGLFYAKIAAQAAFFTQKS